MADVFELRINDDNHAMSPAELAQALAWADVLCPTVTDSLTGALLSAPTVNAKLLANFGVGFNHIDMAAASRAGIAVTNTPGVLTDATAEIALTLMLSSARRAGEGERLVRSGQWDGWHPTHMLSTQVTGKTLGIVGMGRIGQAVARRCHYGFGMEVLFYNRSAKSVDFPATQITSLTELAASVDFLVVTVPGGAETRYLINAEVLGAMQPHGIFVNIARGEVVDETALIDVLEAGKIAGAGLDVYEHEPHVPARLVALENCVLLPHLGSATVETRQAMGQMALDNIIAWSEGREPPQRVN